MGWGSGSALFSDVIESLLQADVPDDTRKLIYEHLIPAFESRDCDTLQECEDDDKVFKEVFRSLNPEYADEEEEDYGGDD